MKGMHIITPVKDSIELTLETVKAIMESEIIVPFKYFVYNDFSTPENTAILEKASREMGFTLVNLSDITDHPSPNYLLVLQMAQERAIAADVHLLIVESDVVVKTHTLQTMYDEANHRDRCGLLAAVTVNEDGVINYPYEYALKISDDVSTPRKHFSFCCTLLTVNFLREFSFKALDPTKNWFDVTISHQSRNMGFENYLFRRLTVLHRPHSSRPWKQLKYKNPLKYYWNKFTKKLDKI